MVVAYLDNGHIVNADVVRSICKDLGVPTREFDYLTPLYEGDGKQDAIGRECEHCGAPIGSKDPDVCKYIILAKCGECRSIL